MIDIVFNKKEFEYDAYTLIKAFYPQEEVSILYEGEEKTEAFQEKEEAFLVVKITYNKEDTRLEVLKNKGVLVNWVPDGCACVEEIQDKEAGTYQFILMDVQMPRMNGYEATQKIRQFADVKKAQIPIIAMTANAFEEDRKHALDAGMDGFIMKPFRVDEMMKVIGEVME